VEIGMMRHKLACLAWLFTPLALFLGTGSAWGHDLDLTTSFSCVGSACQQTSDHEDADPFKGWANITVQNTGTEAWGDFHFEIFETSGGSVENVHFIVDPPYEPFSPTRPGLTWVVDNDAVGATLDLFFYGNLVEPGEWASFHIYTDNTTDQLSFFGLAFYPTPIPEPGTFCLLAAGLIGMAALRRRI
jgi:hypothetical protein